MKFKLNASYVDMHQGSDEGHRSTHQLKDSHAGFGLKADDGRGGQLSDSKLLVLE
jgi:hypothetical protein